MRKSLKLYPGAWKLLTAAALSIALASPLRAQDAPVLRQGDTEVGGFFGVSYGLDNWRGMWGGNVLYAAKRWLAPYGEFSYFPGINRRLAPSGGDVSRSSIFAVPLYDIHGGVHIRLPRAESRVVPYGVFGAGVLKANFTGETSATFMGVTQTVRFEDKSTDFAVNGGGGLRIYAVENWGFRFEAKAYRPVSGRFQDTFGKIEVGIFYQAR